MFAALRITVMHWFAGAAAHGNGTVPRWHGGVVVRRYAGTEAERNGAGNPGRD
jgi:hypothetical protein